MSKADDITMQVKMNNKGFPDIEKLVRGERTDEQQILQTLSFINARYDCADFRMICILRSLYAFAPLISAPTLEAMRTCVLGFKYWMDEPGEDSMCYWSENHQLLFAVCEYLAGQLYPQEIFTNNGMVGTQHMEKARIKIERWLARRYELGFVEFHSNTYYEEDIAPLSLLIDFCKEADMVMRATILLDLLLLDLALHSFEGAFCAASGRCYEMQKKDPARQDVIEIMDKAFGFNRIKQYDYSRLSGDFVLNKKYKVPKAIYNIAHYTQPIEIKDSLGLDLKEVSRAFPTNCDIEDDGLFMWAMEAFTNAESVTKTMCLFNRYKLQTNIFLKDLRVLDIPVIKQLHLLPLVVKLLNPVTQGVAIQRANTITVKTKNYMLSTVQQYHPGEFGDQQHIWQATLPQGVTVFTTHPGASFFEDSARNFSPGYWVGNGINPHSAQHKNISMSLYRLTMRKGMMERKRSFLTHAYFPFAKFDETLLEEKYCFGRKKDGMIAIISLHSIKKQAEDELIQQGAITGWAAIVASTDEYGSLEEFANTVRKWKLEYNYNKLTLHAKQKLSITYKKGFTVDDVPININYSRLQSPFGTVKRNAPVFSIKCNDEILHLNFNKLTRKT